MCANGPRGYAVVESVVRIVYMRKVAATHYVGRQKTLPMKE